MINTTGPVYTLDFARWKWRALHQRRPLFFNVTNIMLALIWGRVWIIGYVERLHSQQELLQWMGGIFSLIHSFAFVTVQFTNFGQQLINEHQGERLCRVCGLSLLLFLCLMAFSKVLDEDSMQFMFPTVVCVGAITFQHMGLRTVVAWRGILAMAFLGVVYLSNSEAMGIVYAVYAITLFILVIVFSQQEHEFLRTFDNQSETKGSLSLSRNISNSSFVSDIVTALGCLERGINDQFTALNADDLLKVQSDLQHPDRFEWNKHAARAVLNAKLCSAIHYALSPTDDFTINNDETFSFAQLCSDTFTIFERTYSASFTLYVSKPQSDVLITGPKHVYALLVYLLVYECIHSRGDSICSLSCTNVGDTWRIKAAICVTVPSEKQQGHRGMRSGSGAGAGTGVAGSPTTTSSRTGGGRSGGVTRRQSGNVSATHELLPTDDYSARSTQTNTSSSSHNAATGSTYAATGHPRSSGTSGGGGMSSSTTGSSSTVLPNTIKPRPNSVSLTAGVSNPLDVGKNLLIDESMHGGRTSLIDRVADRIVFRYFGCHIELPDPAYKEGLKICSKLFNIFPLAIREVSRDEDSTSNRTDNQPGDVNGGISRNSAAIQGEGRGNGGKFRGTYAYPSTENDDRSVAGWERRWVLIGQAHNYKDSFSEFRDKLNTLGVPNECISFQRMPYVSHCAVAVVHEQDLLGLARDPSALKNLSSAIVVLGESPTRGANRKDVVEVNVRYDIDITDYIYSKALLSEVVTCVLQTTRKLPPQNKASLFGSATDKRMLTLNKLSPASRAERSFSASTTVDPIETPAGISSSSSSSTSSFPAVAAAAQLLETSPLIPHGAKFRARLHAHGYDKKYRSGGGGDSAAPELMAHNQMIHHWLILVQRFKSVATELHHDSIVLTSIDGRLTEIKSLGMDSPFSGVPSAGFSQLEGILDKLSFQQRRAKFLLDFYRPGIDMIREQLRNNRYKNIYELAAKFNVRSSDLGLAVMSCWFATLAEAASILLIAADASSDSNSNSYRLDDIDATGHSKSRRGSLKNKDLSENQSVGGLVALAVAGAADSPRHSSGGGDNSGSIGSSKEKTTLSHRALEQRAAIHDSSLHSLSGSIGHHSGPIAGGGENAGGPNTSSGHMEGKTTGERMMKNSSSNDILLNTHGGTDPRLKAVLRDMIQALEFALWNTVMGK